MHPMQSMKQCSIVSGASGRRECTDQKIFQRLAVKLEDWCICWHRRAIVYPDGRLLRTKAHTCRSCTRSLGNLFLSFLFKGVTSGYALWNIVFRELSEPHNRMSIAVTVGRMTLGEMFVKDCLSDSFLKTALLKEANGWERRICTACYCIYLFLLSFHNMGVGRLMVRLN